MRRARGRRERRRHGSLDYSRVDVDNAYAVGDANVVSLADALAFAGAVARRRNAIPDADFLVDF